MAVNYFKNESRVLSNKLIALRKNIKLIPLLRPTFIRYSHKCFKSESCMYTLRKYVDK